MTGIWGFKHKIQAIRGLWIAINVLAGIGSQTHVHNVVHFRIASRSHDGPVADVFSDIVPAMLVRAFDE